MLGAMVCNANDARLDRSFLMDVRGLWPLSRMQGYDSSGQVFAVSYEFNVWWTGTRSPKRIAGVTKDSTGAALAGATVKAYRTAADVNNGLLADLQEGPAAVSDAAGNYEVFVPNADAHYLDAYKAGAPDVAGTTTNTLVGV
jgi:hypothetical protein